MDSILLTNLDQEQDRCFPKEPRTWHTTHRTQGTMVAKVHDENLNITSKVTEMETFRQSISDFIDDCNRNIQKCSNSVDDLQIHCTGMSKLLNTIQSDNEAYKEEILDLKWRSMRENLIFVGIPENYITPYRTLMNT
ncbi:hypothetical protein MAR_016497 [Mya arenaria]|uniref:Uncharacterized protein n=1 Tax=Mya arenaria TaxID=6604 RepID=A0ABY7FPB2_MYAAR|nr:hypothetical protein MAR_016497 [Mya arenaria]